ncbi:hypothetical protein PY247_11685 [Acinetobacter proteolyticus]|nr:hypothetical protein [Acinetobacter proteolyticus]WEI17206.1 hypothetical protein PY247_11685 [Acinetobacter proteolyticus]
MNLIRILNFGLILASPTIVVPTYAADSEVISSLIPPLIESGEIITKTKNGCNLIEKLMNPNAKQARIDAVSKNIWDGVCYNGFALGPGKMIYKNDKGDETGFSEIWYINGRPIGYIKTTFHPSGNFLGLLNEGNIWKNETYNRSVSTTILKEPTITPDIFESKQLSSISHIPQDVTKWVSYTLHTACYDAKSQTTSPCIAENHYNNTGVYENGITRYFCKPGQCLSKWHELTDKLFSGYEDFELAHKAEVDASKKSVEPILLKAKAEKQKADAEAAILAKENKRQAEKIERLNQLTQANQAHKLVSSPALERLIRKALNGGQ